MKGKSRLSYVLTLCLAFILAVAMPFLASAEMIEEWVARYNGPENGSDQAWAIAVDASGNVYVAGGSPGSGTDVDYTTVKYDSAGDELWVKRYNGPGNRGDIAQAIGVDVSGNVYVTGGSEGDYATVKYDTHGNQLWVARYNGPADGTDWARAIAVDASGSVYVTGGHGTVKYDTDGNQLWVSQHGADALAVDVSGSVYVTGGSEGDYATVKYGMNGNQLWVRRYDGLANGDDSARAIAVDTSGNVYVTGFSDGSGTALDCATVKYDTHGNQLWVQRYNGPANDSDRADAIAVDAWGNVYVTGTSDGDGTYCDYATVKYDTNGNQLWVRRYDGPANHNDFANAMAADALGNVYVTGESYSGSVYGGGTNYDYATVKYDTNGNQLWVQRYNGPQNNPDSACSIAIDASGNVYVTGWSYGSGTNKDYATVKYGDWLPAGWSMISLPVRPEVPTVANVFPQAVVVYRYQKGTGYVRVQAGENLEVGMGYWILLDKPRSYITEGAEITEYTIPVSDGWYMIGGCSLPADKTVTSGKIDVVYGYTQGVGYQRLLGSQPLERGKGYWILFSNTSEGAEFTASTSSQ